MARNKGGSFSEGFNNQRRKYKRTSIGNSKQSRPKNKAARREAKGR